MSDGHMSYKHMSGRRMDNKRVKNRRVSGEEIKRGLRDYCGNPDYFRKDEFIRQMRLENEDNRASVNINGSDRYGLNRSRLKRSRLNKAGSNRRGLAGILVTQLHYIRFYTWIISLIVLLIVIAGIRDMDEYRVTYIAEIMPFMAGLGIMESFRARLHGMSELENTTLFSAKGTLFARLTVVGMIHFITICAVAILLGVGRQMQMMNVLMSVAVPYLVTSIMCMEIERTEFGRNHNGSCMVAAVAVAVIREPIFVNLISGLGQKMMITIFLILIGAMLYEIYKMTRQEEYAWS